MEKKYEFNNALVDEKYLDEVNKKLGHPTKKQQEAFTIVVENMNAATILEDMYKYFVDKDEMFPDESKYYFEEIVRDRKPADVVKILKDIAHQKTLADLERQSSSTSVENSEEQVATIPVTLTKISDDKGVEVRVAEAKSE